jgi:hypothetical protein
MRNHSQVKNIRTPGARRQRSKVPPWDRGEGRGILSPKREASELFVPFQNILCSVMSSGEFDVNAIWFVFKSSEGLVEVTSTQRNKVRSKAYR